MNFTQRTRRPEIALELTPLIDVVFLLLIFFMVSTTFAVTSGIDVNLPSSKTTRIEERADKIELSVTSEGRLFWDNAAVNDQVLIARLQSMARENPEMLVVIRADTHVMHGRVFFVMDAAREAGLHRIAIAAEGTRGATSQ